MKVRLKMEMKYISVHKLGAHATAVADGSAYIHPFVP